MSLWLWRVFLAFEDRIIQQILRSPTFHRGVRHVHRKVEDLRHGRNPDEPLRPGEATEDPHKTSFLQHFIDEVKNQIKGTPRDPPGPSPPTK
ncbi:hypothetical protein CONLIGDRAFT_683661 [Coniochaeta ligniaria NRRL 30616]|uniref:Uncharacterized protein n=1 Tax=Coniochaeta ligniaria NRRL 30616 TaxID=1408157 RepID=A0A1J7JAB9_9PEZI|nr:hypothetical protein CONLIGDRAFT_683661 [Coniochaeta ligniaria NRRL 30616]